MTYNAVSRLPLIIRGKASRVHMAGPHTALSPAAALLNEASPFFPVHQLLDIPLIYYIISQNLHL